MKSTIIAAVAIVALGIVSISNLDGGIQVASGEQATEPAIQEAPVVAVQEEAPPAAPVPQEPPTPDDTEPAIQEAPVVAVQEEAPPVAPVPQEPSTPDETDASPSDVPLTETPAVQEPVPEIVVQAAPMILSSEVACDACCCNPCCCQQRCPPCCQPCCPPCSVPTTFCIVEPCSGCSYEICIEVPPCCVGQAPTVTWRNGIFGRKIAQLCWPCCDKRAKVVVSKRGKVRVRG